MIEYHMADSHPELLIELKEILTKQNYKIETKKLFPDIASVLSIKNEKSLLSKFSTKAS